MGQGVWWGEGQAAWGFWNRAGLEALLLWDFFPNTLIVEKH